MSHFSSLYGHDNNDEIKHDYHIMLKPSIKKQAETRAHTLEQSLSAYIEHALLFYMKNTK